ncbi:hypothetical protein PMIN06_003232 [Paraphaeosphaeria minitans]
MQAGGGVARNSFPGQMHALSRWITWRQQLDNELEALDNELEALDNELEALDNELEAATGRWIMTLGGNKGTLDNDVGEAATG